MYSLQMHIKLKDIEKCVENHTLAGINQKKLGVAM